jgi:hypothetical protein
MGERRDLTNKGERERGREREMIVRDRNFQPFHTKSTQSQNSSSAGRYCPTTSDQSIFPIHTDLLNNRLY